MTPLTLTLIRVAFLAVLWLFVIAAIGVVRTDLFGTAARKMRRGQNRPPQRQPQRQPQRPPRQPRPGRGTPRFLVVTEGGLSGMSIDLTDQQITLGRANDATLVLNDDYASSRHARIFPQDGQWIVEDLGSTNGTYLDRQKVTRPMPVPIGVPIRIGKTVLELRR
jgi:pSer/pThr/pTyr-binding forkhead associated (FHA) protein